MVREGAKRKNPKKILVLSISPDMEAGDLRNHFQSNKQNGFFSRFLCYTRNSGSNGSNNSSSNVSSSSRCRSIRRDTPFCSEVRRYKQIVIDELNGKLKLPVTVKALRNKDQMESKSNKAKSHGYPLHKSTTAAA
ncbi:hypothetical protein PVK06_037318 [Gossypium arboreum]|uniref:Uncharacterized protein n=1 Tax=Gossypium arboreum TaxID=29729 RepID=A0ABR0MWZ2_GOSAR|nr:hypothetical protein PVK06_037318 [Gossypium arboreum]